MANLFPATEDMVWEDATEPATYEGSGAVFGRSWKFDFDAGEFVMSPTRKMAVADEKEAWVLWCEKAIRTPRYRHLIYSRDYGSELEELIGSGNRAIQESEIRRMVSETLLADARTQNVDQFVFEWEGESCRFTCRITNIREEEAVLEGSVG
ncbi:DUF2634 domain-containing protein [Paenibacillus sp. FSL M7-1455]|uniref:DUF2634 domain-containing protein n=1 Tax=Paenibacillus sp. FSL M7-1455 TaxID=2975316 RepID=UPI0030FCA24F